VVMHPLLVREVQGSIPGSGKGFMFDVLFYCCCIFTFFSETHYLSQQFAIYFAMLIY